eukprot:4504750-Amphidinium_carterae.1
MRDGGVDPRGNSGINLTRDKNLGFALRRSREVDKRAGKKEASNLFLRGAPNQTHQFPNVQKVFGTAKEY